MRKRHLAAALAVACAATAGGLALAEDPTGAATPGGESTSTVLTLPTGDTVEVVGDALLPRAAPGREGIGFRATRAPGHDRVVMPLDRAVADDDTDDRLYNVDALLRADVRDARTVSSPDSLGSADTPPRDDDAAKTTAIDLKFTWLDGGVPQETWPLIYGLDDDTTVEPVVEAGAGTVDLAPGEYSMVVDMLRRGEGDEPWIVVATVVDFAVTDEAATVTVDGTEAEPVTADLDAEAELSAQTLELFTGTGTTADEQFAHSINFGPADRFYAIPARQRGDHPGGFTYQTEHLDADGDTYSLFNTVDAGIPVDPSFDVAVAELAARRVGYGSLGGTDTEVVRSNWGHHPSHTPYMYPFAVAAKQAQERTEYFTAGPKVGWTQFAYLPSATATERDVTVVNSGQMAPGAAELPWFTAPLSVNLSAEHVPYFRSGLERWPAGDKVGLAVLAPMFSGPRADQATVSAGVTGKWGVWLDGDRIAAGADATEFGVDLPADAAGRFRVEVDVAREVAWTPLGTASSAVWEFDSAPVDEHTVLPVSAVRFDTSGVVDGYAEAARRQEVTLDFETQPGAEDRDCRKLGFEVSYDDGKTWKKVSVKRKGDHATATLTHPADATFVSVRFTGTDDLGQTVTTSTIRSYGLR